MHFKKIFLYLFLALLFSTSLMLIYLKSIQEKPTQSVSQPTIENKISNKKESGADLSYIVFTVDEKVEIHMLDSNGKEVGEQNIEKPIGDPTGQSISTAKLLKVLNYSKPKSSQYALKVISSNKDKFVLDTYLYDKNGEVNMKTFTEESVGEVKYKIEFDKNNSANSSIERK